MKVINEQHIGKEVKNSINSCNCGDKCKDTGCKCKGETKKLLSFDEMLSEFVKGDYCIMTTSEDYCLLGGDYCDKTTREEALACEHLRAYVKDNPDGSDDIENYNLD